MAVDKVCLFNELMYINKKYTSAYFYVITDSKEIFIFYEFIKSGFSRQLQAMLDAPNWLLGACSQTDIFECRLIGRQPVTE